MRYPAHFPDDHPDDPRTFIPNIEFYITNVCNIACPQCNRFNNWNFKGHQIWKDYYRMIFLQACLPTEKNLQVRVYHLDLP